MALLEIIKIGEEVLNSTSNMIEHIDDSIKKLASSMVETMHKAPGVGLSAPQVGQSIRLITVDLSAGKNKEDLFIIINPEIIKIEGENIGEEGCLSIPNIYEDISRPAKISVKGLTLEGKELIIQADELLARVICHEIDHLNGILFIDYLSPLKRKLIKKKISKVKKKDNK